ncbi:aliphatic sulfonate ABC transporter substrate-binding protein [Microbacterium album]|uniref:ABC transporter substrate-binding protein n=1 Tax=Microbacterium album TaxID=2053191 RepID=A0A917IH12_9MICO|nr:aliphatic sulfonate ABC transporter substrate-binding protein [Microbacterium album]GGH45678.1 ABC transporter substrate-binding protein [Microbacterium album]
MRTPTRLSLLALTAGAAVLLSGCAGEGSRAGSGDGDLTELNVDYATYNVLSLVIKDQGWLEEELDGVAVNWVFSAGSNKANEFLRSGSIDFGTTGGGPALQARANGTEIKTVYITHASEGFGLAVPADSPLQDVEDLVGESVAVTRGTDPYFFLLQALDLFDVPVEDVTLENLQHADGRAALDNGTVDAWSGLDPILAGAEVAGSRVIYTNPELISPIFLNVTESFEQRHPETVQLVIDVYERARAWVLDNPEEALEIYAAEAGLEPEVAELAFSRFNHDVDGVPDAAQLAPVLTTIGGFMVESGDVRDQASLDDALESLFEPKYAQAAAE